MMGSNKVRNRVFRKKCKRETKQRSRDIYDKLTIDTTFDIHDKCFSPTYYTPGTNEDWYPSSDDCSSINSHCPSTNSTPRTPRLHFEFAPMHILKYMLKIDGESIKLFTKEQHDELGE
jgi:hypothetical protein